MSVRPILLVDFDGVIHSYMTPWSKANEIPDPPVEGAIKWLLKAVYFFDVQIYSSRSREEGGVWAMKQWLAKYINEHTAQSRSKSDWGVDWIEQNLSFPTKKPAAFLTIDDRALTFRGTWTAFDPEKLLEFKPWNRG